MFAAVVELTLLLLVAFAERLCCCCCCDCGCGCCCCCGCCECCSPALLLAASDGKSGVAVAVADLLAASLTNCLCQWLDFAALKIGRLFDCCSCDCQPTCGCCLREWAWRVGRNSTVRKLSASLDTLKSARACRDSSGELLVQSELRSCLCKALSVGFFALSSAKWQLLEVDAPIAESKLSLLCRQVLLASSSSSSSSQSCALTDLALLSRLALGRRRLARAGRVRKAAALAATCGIDCDSGNNRRSSEP